MAGQKKAGKKKSLEENLWIRYQKKRIKKAFQRLTGADTGDKPDRMRGRKPDRSTILVAVGALIVVIALCGLGITMLEYHKSTRIYGKAEKEYVTILETAEASSAGAAAGNDKGQDNSADGAEHGDTGDTVQNSSVGELRPWYESISVDLESLQEAYPDVAGWIYFENEKISYPVMYSGDNEKYLRTAYTGKAANAGSIFMDGESSPDFSDPHTLIYGHNMKNLSMFGRLRYYRTDKDYYDTHRYFQIFTGGYIYRYEILAYGQVSADDDLYYVYGADPGNDSLRALMKELKGMAPQGSSLEPGVNDHLVTLSTCTGDGNVRMIVSAVRVDEHRR